MLNYKKFKYDCENIKKVYRSGSGAVITENYYLLHKSISGIKKHSFKKPLLYKNVYKYLLRADFCFSQHEMLDYFLEKQITFSISDVYALSAVLNACLISAIGGECLKLLKNRRSENKRILNSINSFRKINDLDIEIIFDRLCPVEKLLEKYIPYFDSMDAESKEFYRSSLVKHSKKHKIEENTALTRAAKKFENPEDAFIKDKKTTQKITFYIVNFFIFAALSVPVFLYLSYLSFFAFPAVYDASLKLCEFIFPRFIKPGRPLRISLEEIPDSAKTLVVTTTLLLDGDSKAFDRLEEFYLKNRKKNLYFGILGDFKDSKNRHEEGDNEILQYAKKRTGELNRQYGNVFSLFIREREYNERDKVYSGRERKRGAVCDLVDLISGVKNNFVHSENTGYIEDISYVLTLDADTNLPLGGVVDLLGILLHPRNTPIVKDGKIIRGYGILQPCMRTELASSYRTYFSLMHSGDGGGMYERTYFDRYQTLTGSGVFCGKGIFSVNHFAELVNGKLPDNLILSHDMPEGCILRCMLVTDMTFTDGTPKNSVSYFTRLHRWIRGDIQNLPLIAKPYIDFSGKYKIFENVRRHFIPFFSGLGLLIFALMPNIGDIKAAGGFAIMLSYLLTPAFLTVAAQLFKRSFTPRRFFSLAINSFFQSLSVLMFEVSAVFEYAYTVADASVRSVYRMLKSRKKLLEWTTFTQSEGVDTDSFLYYIQKNITSAVIGTVMFIFSPWIIFRIYGLLCFLTPVISYFMARKIEEHKDKPTKKQLETVRSYAFDHFKFFSQRVNKKTNYLPPDNVQLSPADRTAYRTSPTNIGFYLLSLLAAYDFQFISADTLLKALENTLETIESMEKWKGHLYNWYDIKTLKTIGSRYVSTVDSGNLVTMLITLAGGLDTLEGGSGLAERCRKIAGNTDFSPLYNKKKNLYFLGYDCDKNDSGEICYDLLMSEIRTTCYYLTACGLAPRKHWRSLGRTIVENDGFIGMVSWSGTAFEYFMPELFLPNFKNSFIWESLQFACYNQKKQKKNKIFGISESGFYSFDSDMNYQYKANGVQATALKRYNADEAVVSPYSSFLMLGTMGGEVLKNLETMREMGLYGEYGFYEAIDFNRSGGAIVRSYMSHHLGMSIVACANYCHEGIFIKRFMNDKRLAAAAELLCERIPSNVHLFDEGDYSAKPEIRRSAAQPVKTSAVVDLANPQAALISCGNLTLAASSNGHISMRYGSYLISNTVFASYSGRATAAVTFIKNGKPFGFTPLDGNKQFLFEKSDRHFAFISSDNAFPVSLAGTVLREDGVFLFKAKWDRKIKTAVGFSFAPVLDTAASFYSHQAFSSLFVVSSYLEDEKIIIFQRRKRSEGERFPICAVALGDETVPIYFTTSAENLESGSISNPCDYFNKPADNFSGVCLTPVCVIKTDEITRGEVDFLVAAAYTAEDCVRGILRARKKRFAKSYEYSMNALSENALKNILFSKNGGKLMTYNGKMLWKYGISGDYPLIVVNVFEENKSVFNDAFNAFLTFAAAFMRTELIYIINERDRYLSPLRQAVTECAAQNGCDRFMNHRGGIHIINRDAFNENEFNFLKAIAVYFGESDEITVNIQAAHAPALPEIVKKPESYNKSDINGLKVYGGEFADNGFMVDKKQILYAPYSYVLSGRSVGGVVTDKSLGFTYFMNAREKKLTPFDTNPFYSLYGETLYIFLNGKIYDACACSGQVFYKDGRAVYQGIIDGLEYTVRVSAASLMPYKIITLEISEPVRAAYVCSLEGRSMCAEKTGNGVFYTSMKNGIMDNVTAFVYTPCKCEVFTDLLMLLTGFDCGKNDVAAVAATDTKFDFYIGAAPSLESVKRITELITPETAVLERDKSFVFVKKHLPPVSLNCKSETANQLFNHFIPYQAAFSRFFGKTGFYQTGGAFGFRDQLQDCLAMIYSAPHLVRTHIIRSCAHQYREGDVMHWWYKNSGETYGIRTKCSDDFLFLPYVTADYIKKTGDYSVLDIQVAYLESPPLGNHAERYEKAVKGPVSETVYLHCIRALVNGERQGKHGLSLMGSCDWNDAFSNIGTDGKGESVFSSFLFILAVRAFLPVFKHFGDFGAADHYEKSAEKVAENIEKHCYTGNRYLRAFFDDGTPLGSEDSEECKIDILSQCFAAMVFGRTERTVKALETAYNALFDKENKILRLFSPPFDKVNAGYIRGYAAGVRENGGQYTHAY